MDALDQSDELMRACEKLRARSVRIRADAAEMREKSRRLFAAAHKAQEAVMRAYGVESAGYMGRATAGDTPASR